MSSYMSFTGPGTETTPPAGPTPWGRAASRRMCAAVYLDREFRDKVLRDAYCDRNRRVAPSYGFDLVVVVLHAWRAWLLEFIQNVVVLAALVIAIVDFPIKAVIAAEALAIFYLVTNLLGVGRDLAAYYRGQGSYPDFEKMRSRGNVLLRATLALCIAFAGTIYWQWRLNGHREEAWPYRSGLVWASGIFVVVTGSIAITSAIRRAILGHLRKRDVGAHGRLKGRLATLDNQQRHPITVYSGYQPFIGSGIRVRTWSFAQRLVRRDPTGNEPHQEYEQPPFRAENLLVELRAAMRELRDENHPETQLPGLTVSDRVFIEGTHASDYVEILKEPAKSPRVADEVSKIIANAGDVARHYLACEVESWGGEIITTVFMHVSLQGRTLYIEFSTFALLPTRSEYHVVDELGGTGPGAVTRAGLRGLTDVADAAYAPHRFIDALIQIGGAVRAQRDGTKRARPRVNIGAKISVREEAAEGSDESYFQVQDIFQHWKIIERRLIATVGDFLKGAGVDTSEFWQRTTAILNSGVMNIGSGTINMNAGGIAVGDQATVFTDAAPAAEQ